MRFLWLVSLFVLWTSSFCFAKETLDFNLGINFEQSKLVRSSDSAANFSLNSNEGYRAKLSIDKYFTSWWLLHLGGEYAVYNYEASASRVINNPDPTETIGEGGFKFKFGDFEVVTHY
ncbi:MAG: hypothetical protein AAF202_12505, partial [Pseudomonadota bacterium]